MAVFIGRHINRIDKKGRISVPKPFRSAVKDQSFKGIYVFPSFKAEALEACDEDFMNRFATSVDDLDVFSDEQDDLAATVLEITQALPFDTEGRVILPRDFLDYARITDHAAFVGRGTRFQIWEPESYEIHRARAVDRARSRGATLKLRPKGDVD